MLLEVLQMVLMSNIKKLAKSKLLRFSLYSILTIFTCLYLINKIDFNNANIVWQVILNPVALLFGAAGFVFDALIWRNSFKRNQSISKSTAIIACGLTIWFKYIPGKIWSLWGRPHFLDQTPKPHTIAIYSVLYQMVFFLPIPIFGIMLSLYIFPLKFIVLTTILSALLLVLALYYFSYLREKIIYFRIEDLYLSFAMWCSWGIGYAIIVYNIVPTDTLTVVRAFLTFPVSTAGAILTIFAPGGIGVREYIMQLLLGRQTAIIADIATILVCSRLWFLASELIFFCGSVFLSMSYKNDK